MRLESARSLKTELLERIVPWSGASAGVRRSRVIEPDLVDALESVAAQPSADVPSMHRLIALGIAPPRPERAADAQGYRLAIRIQRPALVESDLVARMVSRSLNEADVRFIGRVTKRTRPRRLPVAGPAKAAPPGDTPWYRSRLRPLRIGASVGHVDVTAGTIGAFVTRAGTEHSFVLSNNHVLANENRGRNGDAVLQPGRFDGGTTRDRVGTLARTVKLKLRGANLVDAALARLGDDIEADWTLLPGSAAAPTRLAGVADAPGDLGTAVWKVGRTTGLTIGRVTAFELDNVVVSYDIGHLRFDGQLEMEGAGTEPFSDGGDSGALILNPEQRAVGLLFAGGDAGGINGRGLTYANPLDTVLEALGATLRLR